MRGYRGDGVQCDSKLISYLASYMYNIKYLILSSVMTNFPICSVHLSFSFLLMGFIQLYLINGSQYSLLLLYYQQFYTHSDINECLEGTHNCHANADCTDLTGSYSCACKVGYSGNGFICTGLYLTNDKLKGCPTLVLTSYV